MANWKDELSSLKCQVAKLHDAQDKKLRHIVADWFGQWNTLFATLAAVSALVLISLGTIGVVEKVVTERVKNTLSEQIAIEAAGRAVQTMNFQLQKVFGLEIDKNERAIASLRADLDNIERGLVRTFE